MEDTAGVTGTGTCVTLPMNISNTSTTTSGSASNSGSTTTGAANPAVVPLVNHHKENPIHHSIHSIGSMAVNSISKPKHFSSKAANRKQQQALAKAESSLLNGHPQQQDSSNKNSSSAAPGDDSSSSDQDRGRKSPPKRKPPKVKRKKGGSNSNSGAGGKKGPEEKKRKGVGGQTVSTGPAGYESASDSEKETGSEKDSDSGASSSATLASNKKTTNNNNTATNNTSANNNNSGSTNTSNSNTNNSSSNSGSSVATGNNNSSSKEQQPQPRKRGRRPKSSKNDKGEESSLTANRPPAAKKPKEDPSSHHHSSSTTPNNQQQPNQNFQASNLLLLPPPAQIPPQRDSFRKPPVSQLKKTGESFLQDGPCFEVAPKLGKCRECRWTPHQRSKNMPNIFCRFYAFRRLRYTKNGQLAIAGFSDPHKDAMEDDIKLWLPNPDSPPPDLDLDTSRFILKQVGDHFCDLFVQEKEAHAEYISDDDNMTVAWKRVVQGVREMCDVCETTLFNFHWACGKCGFVVCLDCYKSRKNGSLKIWGEPGKDRDDYSWLLCTNRQAHEQEKLMLTQIIAGDSLAQLGKLVHEMRELWNIEQFCACPQSKEQKPASSNSNSTMYKEIIKKILAESQINGLKREIKEEKENAGDASKPTQNGIVKEERQSPLNWLADVALSNKTDEKSKTTNDDHHHHHNNTSSDSDEGSFSTLRELLIRPSHKPNGSSTSRASSPTSASTNANNNNNNNNNGSQQQPAQNKSANNKKSSSASAALQKLDTLDDVISSVIEDSVPKTDEQTTNDDSSKFELKHFLRRYNWQAKGRAPLPIRIMTLTESKLLYPDVPHSWLCDGKLLRLSDSTHKDNYKIFQDQWKRGQPVIVSDVTRDVDKDLWTPDSFARDFGEEKNDLINCMTGNLVPNQPMRKFWEGFDHFSKRLKDERGNPMLLKLKDWPPGEDFAEMLPTRFIDLMKVLPLSEYTHRTGRLNLASRLPDCFVRPDLGPKMYNAYGSALHPSKGTTNLHLDISDAVNVMVYVGIPKDGDTDEHIKEAFRAIDEAGCDILTRRRVRDKGELPGALWHIYNARDADKIRDLLNKVVVEKGGRLEPHHDPIHDQSCYLDGPLRERLYKEYGVEGYAIVQCLGDAVFIPAGAPHQVRNLHNCIKVAEDFVSPENVSHCFHLTQEFRDLSDTHTNHEDKLQIKNIIYHAVKDALSGVSSVLNRYLKNKTLLATEKDGNTGTQQQKSDSSSSNNDSGSNQQKSVKQESVTGNSSSTSGSAADQC